MFSKMSTAGLDIANYDILCFKEEPVFSMLVSSLNVHFTGQAQITDVTAADSRWLAPVTREARPWSPPRRPASVLCAMIMLQATITVFGPARAAKLSSKEVSKVIM